jgi:hypothetical protein
MQEKRLSLYCSSGELAKVPLKGLDLRLPPFTQNGMLGRAAYLDKLKLEIITI